MKLLSINNYHYRRAGSDAAFLDHDRLFRGQGWETATFSMKHRENLASPWQEYFASEIELARDHSLATKLRLAGKVIYSRDARIQLRRLLGVFRPDIVHVHSVYHHISPAIFPILGSLNVPIVLTAHDYKLACPAYKMFDGVAICEQCRGGRLFPLVRKRCLHDSMAISALVGLETAFHRMRGYYRRYVDRIICPSRFHLQKLIEWGWPSDRLIHIANFFDASLWTPKFEPGQYFLYFGRIAPEKGLHTLVRASAHTQHPLKVVGWGTLIEDLQRLAKSLGAPVEFIERLPPRELAVLIRGARAVVLPSEWYENASLAVLEAFACGKPVLAARIGGNPETVFEGVNGWLFESGNVEALASRLNSIWNMSGPQIEVLGREAHSYVSRRHNATIYYEAMTRLYNSLQSRYPELARGLR